MSKANDLIESINELDEKMTEKDFATPFDADDFKKFSKKYPRHKLDKQVEDAGEGELRLVPKMRKELAITHNTFSSEGFAEKRIKQVKAGLIKQANDAIKKAASDLGIKTSGIKVSASVHTDNDIKGGNDEVTIMWKGEELELDGGVYFGNDDEHGNFGDSAESWDWAAWLGDEDSPLGDRDWLESYFVDDRSQRLEQLSDLDSQGDLDDKVKAFLQSVDD